MVEGASTAVALAEPARRQAAKVPLVAGNSPRAIVPVDFEGAWRIASAVVGAKMAPRSLETVEKCTVAILHGLEVGMTPMVALQSIAVIGNRPCLWGDGALGKVQSSGLLDDQDEHFEGQEGTDTFKAVCILKRKAKPRPYTGEFSIADARKAGLLGKEGPWQGYQKRMLKMRARAFALRDGFSDVLKGLGIAEEQEDVERAKTPPVDDGGGPPEPANDDGGGPPVPAQETTKVEVVDDGGGPPVPEIVSHPDNGVSEDADRAKQAREALADDDFPGDKPMKPAADDGLDIPDYLRRSPSKPPLTDDDRDWLDSLENSFSSCEDLGSLSDEQARLMTPQENVVSTTAWNEACDKLDYHIERVNSAGG